MGTYRALDRSDQLKSIADPHRLALLRRLMAGRATITQLGAAFGKHPAWIRYHVKTLEAAGLVELVETKTTGNYTEKFYQANASAFSLQMLVTPEFGDRSSLVVVGSHDFAVEMLADNVNSHHKIVIVPVAVGSLDGLIALRQGLADAAGCHLLDADSSEYNVPYIRHIFPDRSITVITLSHREQGLIVPSGNPRDIRGIEDIASGIRFINRNPGSGTRVWLDRELARQKIPVDAIAGFDETALTHTDVAVRVATGGADVGLGIRAAADRLGLAFVPLFQERYDLAVPTARLSDPMVQELIEPLTSAGFCKNLSKVPGYDTRHTGDLERVAG
ncbi:MAG: helix-turn-helix domain-containing protein [Coriobacteriia bacterium]|nr:helix-turn-helix domain-containing protein [Coriobacteriia bacterium]MBN2822546.1 helix-turn-helix domain-containing protein [Coriobacteriia bacterium]